MKLSTLYFMLIPKILDTRQILTLCIIFVKALLFAVWTHMNVSLVAMSLLLNVMSLNFVVSLIVLLSFCNIVLNGFICLSDDHIRFSIKRSV